MEIDKLNSLVELYFKKCDEVDLNRPFLKWLKSGKPTLRDLISGKEKSISIKELVNEIKKII